MKRDERRSINNFLTRDICSSRSPTNRWLFFFFFFSRASFHGAFVQRRVPDLYGKKKKKNEKNQRRWQRSRVWLIPLILSINCICPVAKGFVTVVETITLLSWGTKNEWIHARPVKSKAAELEYLSRPRRGFSHPLARNFRPGLVFAIKNTIEIQESYSLQFRRSLRVRVQAWTNSGSTIFTIIVFVWKIAGIVSLWKTGEGCLIRTAA